MSAVVINHPLLALSAAFLAGFLGEWLLELFFFRRRLFDTDAALRRREREVADLRFELARAGERLKNRELEIEATLKSRQSAETQIVLGRQEVEHLKSELRLTETELAQETRIRLQSDEKLASESAALAQAHRLIAFLEAETNRLGAEVVSVAADLAIASAGALTEAEANGSLRAALAAQTSDLEAVSVRVRGLERSLFTSESVRQTLLDSLRARDQQLEGLTAEMAGKEDERATLSRALAAADERCAALAAQVRQLKEDSDRVFSDLQTARGRIAAEESKLETAFKARSNTESQLKRREAELADFEHKLAEYQSAFADAAKENSRLTQELARFGTQLMAAEAARKQGEAEKAKLKEEADALQARVAEIPRLEAAARDSAEQDEIMPLRLQLLERDAALELANSGRWALESELQAVSASHARLELELAELRKELDAAKTAAAAAQSKSTADLEATLNDLEMITRERDGFAAELAALRTPAAGAGEELSAVPASANGTTSEPITEYVVECPQRLGELQGVGQVLEARLYAAGIGSFWQLSQTDARRLAEIFELDGESAAGFDFDGLHAEALRRVEETESAGRKWSGDAPDDLSMIDGLGEFFQRRLADAGICRFETLGRSTADELAKLCPPGPGRDINYTVWIEQARMLAEASTA